ncbi:hypothetical protein MVEN_02474400 [Mycena venus]|uniref:Uncharacterized protein n=1 Tax=Mycena venus TaxID=2733690 RepID=A0A8H6WXN6_9AGAR|nr:hypothetical protein MVEN_02474400 [Mycena venus]
MDASSSTLDDLRGTTHVENASQANTDQQTAINLFELDPKISVKKFMKNEHRMPPDTLQLFTLTIRHPTHGEIGYITAIRVQHRRQCRAWGTFLELMDVDTELFTIASSLSNKYGELRPCIVDNEYYKGTGVWGPELNDGNLIIVLCVSVDIAYRKQGVASWGFQRLYASQYVEREDKMLCWPSPIPRPPSDQWIPVFDRIVEIFRKIWPGGVSASRHDFFLRILAGSRAPIPKDSLSRRFRP